MYVFLFEFCLLLHISHFYGIAPPPPPPFFFLFLSFPFTFWKCVLNGLDQRDRMFSTFASKKAKRVCAGIFFFVCVYIYICTYFVQLLKLQCCWLVFCKRILLAVLLWQTFVIFMVLACTQIILKIHSSR